MPTKMNPEVPKRTEFELLPKDTYDIIIESIEDDKRKKWDSDEEEDYIKFTFVFTSGEYKDRKLCANATPKLFPGTMGLSPSTLYSILSAVTRKDYTDDELKEITAEDVNALRGQALQVYVTQITNKKGEIRNKIESYLPPKAIEVAKAKKDTPTDPEPDEINPKNIPF